MDFTEDQIQRYSRHIILPEVGGLGQIKIRQASCFIVGAGGLGAPAAMYLAAAGIGKLGIIDDDNVDLSNLQRQVIHHTRDVGTHKAESAKAKINAMNPDVEVVIHRDRLKAHNARELVAGYDYILDGTDNFATKFLINDLSVFTGIPMVHGGILRFSGQAMVVIPGQSACYRCVFHEAPPEGIVPTCQEAGVLGVLAGVIGTIQATEVLKMVLGIGTVLKNRLLTYQALESEFREVRVKKNPKCPVCGDHPTITELVDGEDRACAL
ncbi:MAG: molybdopterin-synthase adenylyltransferase MoeB [Nitrospirota bacterium]|nr:molybdopterin-synthase adenylyltransferase MoeB [Nitrospirota bacterium]